jgi:hypothetical protein
LFAPVTIFFSHFSKTLPKMFRFRFFSLSNCYRRR